MTEITRLVSDLAAQFYAKQGQSTICGTQCISDELFDEICDNETIVLDRQIAPRLAKLIDYSNYTLTKIMTNQGIVLGLIHE